MFVFVVGRVRGVGLGWEYIGPGGGLVCVVGFCVVVGFRLVLGVKWF